MTANPDRAAVEEIVRAFAEGAKLAISPDDVQASAPPRGDFSVSCFKLAAKADLTPPVLASVTAVALNDWAARRPAGLIQDVAAAGPYLNVTLRRERLAAATLAAVNEPGDRYGRSATGQGQRIVLEYASPNTNKPLHLGHLRNAALGWSVSRILEHAGYEVVKTAIINDRGIHIMKPMLAYQRWSEAWDGRRLVHETPANTEMKSDAFVGKYYVLFETKAKDNAHLTEAAQELLRRWEQGDAEVRALWKKMNAWATKGILETCERFGVSFDKLYYESDLYEEGRQIVLDQVAAGRAQRNDDGSVTVDLSDEGLGTKVLLRADGTSVYITQDLPLVKHRLADYRPDRLVYVVGQEQDYQFRVLFSVLDRFGLVSRDRLRHLSYHWVFLPEGRMKSREGKIVDADGLLDELEGLALEEIQRRHGELLGRLAKHRAKLIALAAAKYYLLAVRPDSDIRFDPAASLKFAGRTGPYLLYTYARLTSLGRKAGAAAPEPSVAPVVTDTEWAVVRHLARFPETVERAAASYDPSLLADFAYGLAKAVNDAYEIAPVLQAEPATRAWRLALVAASRRVLGTSLQLLGIEPLEEM